MSIPDYQTLMLPVLRLAAEGETRVADVAGRIADELGLSPDEREQMLPSGRQRLLVARQSGCEVSVNQDEKSADWDKGRA